MVPASLIKKLPLIAIGIILLIGGFLRLYKISDYMTFLGDEGRDAIVVRDILLGKNFPLIGPGTSVGNMYLGPLYYYLISPSLLLANFSPVGPAIFVAIIGLLTIGFLWWIGRLWFGEFLALLISLLYAVSPVVITYSRASWNPNIMPFFALLCIYGIWRVWRSPRLAEGQKSNSKWLLITAISFAFVLNSHYLGLLLAPTLGVFWILIKNKSFKSSLFSLLILLFLLSPIAIFDISHNWTNAKALKSFLTDRQQTVNFKAYKAIPNLWPIWTDINTTLLTAGNKTFGSIVSVVVLLTLTLTLIKNRKLSPELLLVITWLAVGIIGLGLYKQHIYSHYFGFLFPAPFILLGLLVKQSGGFVKFLLYGFSVCIIVLNFINNPLRIEPNRQLTRTRQIADHISTQSMNKPFNLALISRHNYDASYRYFLDISGSAYYPIQDLQTDQLFVICEINDCQPINHPLYEIAAFGWAKVDQEWSFPWQVKVFKLVPNPSGS